MSTSVFLEGKSDDCDFIGFKILKEKLLQSQLKYYVEDTLKNNLFTVDDSNECLYGDNSCNKVSCRQFLESTAPCLPFWLKKIVLFLHLIQNLVPFLPLSKKNCALTAFYIKKFAYIVKSDFLCLEKSALTFKNQRNA